MATVDLKNWEFLGAYTHPIQKPTREILGRDKEMQSINASLNRPELCNVMLIAEAGAGKALANNTLIPVPTDEVYKPIGLLKVGDMVYDDKGYPTNVIGVFPQGRRKAYKLTFEDDSVIVCNDEHIWNVRHQSEEGFVNLTLAKMLEKDSRDGAFYVRNNGGVRRPIRTLPQDAYQAGFEFGSESVRPVPKEYFAAHLMQRRSFIHGAMDACGILEIDGNDTAFCMSFKSELARNSFDDFCNSVGLRTKYGPSARSQYSLRLLNIADLSSYLPIKALDATIVDRRVRITRETSQIRLMHVEELFRDEEMTCIYVDSPSHLFQAGTGHIVTHNTAVVQGLMMKDKERQYLEVDLAKMIADLHDPNEMANRLKRLFDEAQEYREKTGHELVLFIDEFHQVVQLSAAAVEALKPILADSGVRGIKVIAATTTEEFIQWIKPNLPLQERLQRINLPVMDEDTTVSILKAAAKTYGVDNQFYNDYMFHKIYEYTNRYIPASVQPRKSIRILDAMIGWHRASGKKLDENLLAEVIQESENVKVNFSVDAVNIKKAMEGIHSISVKADKVITVENLTTYHDCDEADAVYIYLGGYHNTSKQKLLELIYENNGDRAYYHEGDLDVYGFLILENLIAKTQIPFKPLLMDVETIERFYRAGLYKSLTTRDRKMIDSKKDGQLSAYKDVLEYMLAFDCKVEQESIKAVELIERQ